MACKRNSVHPRVCVLKYPGRKEPHHPWVVQWREVVPPFNRRKRAVSTDHSVAVRYAIKLSREIEEVRLGLIEPHQAELLSASRTPPADHLAEFKASMIARGLTLKRAEEVCNRILKILDACEFDTLRSFDDDAVQAAVADRIARGLSACSTNKYIKDFKQFGRWLHRSGRLPAPPGATLRTYNEAADRRHVRRALTGDEIKRLLDATAQQPPMYGMSGPERWMLYFLALNTGLRRKELLSLTADSFRLDGAPTVTVEAAHSKHRRRDVLPLDPLVAQLVLAWLNDKPAQGPLFKQIERTSRAIYADLAAAGVPARTTEGIIDFHSLRHSFVTMLAQSGADVGSVRELARHSELRTTQRYMHGDQTTKLKALAALPARQCVASAVDKLVSTC